MSAIDRWSVTEFDGEPVLAVHPEEMVDLLAVVEAAERCLAWWLNDAPNSGEFTALGDAIETWGEWL